MEEETIALNKKLEEIIDKHYKEIKEEIDKIKLPGDKIEFDGDRGGEYIVIVRDDEEIATVEYADKFINLFGGE